MMRSTCFLILALVFTMPAAWGDARAGDLSRNVQVYIYQPWVFADRKLSIGLPANTDALRAFLWYLRMDESTRGRFEMEPLGRFVLNHRVPGLDFSGHRTLNNGDVERLFSSDFLRSKPAPTYKFRLLKLSGTLTDDRALATVGRLADLQVLSLSERVTDGGIKFLKRLPHLHALTVPSPHVTDGSVETLAQLSRLQRLSVKAAPISDAGLKKLQHLPLRQIDLGPAVTDVGLTHLESMITLQEINVAASRITNKGLASLAKLPALHTLFLGSSVSDADAPALAGFKQLKRLDLTGARLTDEVLPILAGMTQLEEIALTDTQITGKVLETLGALPKLRYLEISGMRGSPPNFKAMRGFPALEILSFSSPQRLHLPDIQPLGQLDRLHTLVINRQPLGRRLVEYLREKSMSRSRLNDWFIRTAHAAGASDVEVEKVLELASAPPERTPRPFRGLSGLPLIHETAASLDEVVSAPSMINQDNQQDSEKNFLGEFTIEAGGKIKKK